MIATELIGLWETCPYDYGSMESSTLALRTDGTGWSTWANIAHAMVVRRFTWNCPAAGALELRYTTLISGTWEAGSATLATTDVQGPDDTVLLTTYTIGHDATAMAKDPFTALHLAEPIEFSHNFALARRDVHTKDDPARGTADHA